MPVAVIDLGGTRTKFGLMDEGEVICASSCPADAQGSLEGHLDEILEHLGKLCPGQGTALEACDGIGLLSTGLVNNREMRVLSTNGKYDDAVGFDFRAWSRNRTGLELRMDNDARGALIGEWRYGAGRGSGNLVMVTIGTGIGTAVISEGKPLTGPHFTGGNLGGHMLVRSGGRKCTCGGVGCLESEASGWVLPILVQEHAQYGESSLNGLESLGYREVMKHAAEGDGCARDVLDHCLQFWGEALVSFIHLFDPERIIVGGGIMNEPEPVLQRFRDIVSELAWAEEGQVSIVKAEHPDNAGLIGAGALFYTAARN
ncbi:MAG: ROK family protein [Verrucomicrobia bacterium]|jgi:glucokinase|nr:ROK family protein [Verrucomicrobiota bacterium]